MSRGGKREGAGRKSLVPGKKHQHLMLSEEAIKMLSELSQRDGISKSDYLDILIKAKYKGEC